MNTADQLDEAADLIERRGWMKGGGWVLNKVLVLPTVHDIFYEVREDLTGPVCLEGALWAVVRVGVPGGTIPERLPFECCPAYQAVIRYLGDDANNTDAPGGRGTGWGWNDNATRTKTEVLAALRGAALMVRAEETATVTV